MSTEYGQSSTFGMTGPTCFTPPAHGMSGASFFIPIPITQAAAFSSTKTLDPAWGSYADLITGSGSAFSAFGQAYGGMSGAGGSSYGAGGSSYVAGGSSYGAAVDTVVPPSATTYAECAAVDAEMDLEAESEADEESEAYETESDTQPKIQNMGKTVVENTPRPQWVRKPGEKTKEPWTSGSKFTNSFKKVFGGLKKKTQK